MIDNAYSFAPLLAELFFFKDEIESGSRNEHVKTTGQTD